MLTKNGTAIKVLSTKPENDLGPRETQAVTRRVYQSLLAWGRAVKAAVFRRPSRLPSGRWRRNLPSYSYGLAGDSHPTSF